MSYDKKTFIYNLNYKKNENKHTQKHAHHPNNDQRRPSLHHSLFYDHLPPHTTTPNANVNPPDTEENPNHTEEVMNENTSIVANNKTHIWTQTTKLDLPHPLSLQVLPSPIDKWSATTHPIKAKNNGYHHHHISYKHFYFHKSRVLLTKAFALSMTASTVGDGGKPKGSTALDAICGSNCIMTTYEYRLFAQLVLGLGQQHGNMPNKCQYPRLP